MTVTISSTRKIHQYHLPERIHVILWGLLLVILASALGGGYYVYHLHTRLAALQTVATDSPAPDREQSSKPALKPVSIAVPEPVNLARSADRTHTHQLNIRIAQLETEVFFRHLLKPPTISAPPRQVVAPAHEERSVLASAFKRAKTVLAHSPHAEPDADKPASDDADRIENSLDRQDPLRYMLLSKQASRFHLYTALARPRASAKLYRHALKRLSTQKAVRTANATPKHPVSNRQHAAIRNLKATFGTTAPGRKPASYLHRTGNPALLRIARKQLGKHYIWGATGPRTFDCSGFTSYVFRKLGVNIPRTSRNQSRYGKLVRMHQLRPGDLIFFDTSRRRRGYVNHVGIYLGNDQFIHASSARHKVIITSLKKTFYHQRFKWARRVN